MSQKIRKLLTVLVTGFLTLAVLLGATYLYNKLVYTDPLRASVTEIASIGSLEVKHLNSRSVIKVRFNVQEKLRPNFYLLLDQLEGQKYRESERLTIVIENEKSTRLQEFLTESRLPVFEAISTGRFTALPANLNQLGKDLGVQYDLEIDNNYIFITASRNSESAHMIISRGDSPLNIVNTMGGEYL